MILKPFAFAFCFVLFAGASTAQEAVLADVAKDGAWERIMVDGELAQGVVAERVCLEEDKADSLSVPEKDRCKTIYRHHSSGTVVAINGRWMAGCILDDVPATQDIASPRNVKCNLSVQTKATPEQVHEALSRSGPSRLEE